jgi:hypothetical protein
MNLELKFTLTWHGNQWYVQDPHNVNLRVPIDTAVVDVTYQGDKFVEGYIVAVHGLDQEIAQHLSKASLQALGVGAQLRRNPAKKVRRGQLAPGGRVDWKRN